MTEREQPIADWQTKLEDAFADASGVLGERVQRLDKAERAHALELTQRLAGFTTLVESYQDFALQSLAEVSRQSTVHHIMSFSFHVAAFKRFRVALNALYDGYYFDAVGTLRGVFEVTMYVGAVLKGHFSFNDLYDMASEQEILHMDPLKLQKLKHNHVSKMERGIRGHMFGGNSKLTQNEQAQIKGLLMCLHMSVHRGQSTVASLVLDAVKKGRIPQVEPCVDLESASAFCNTAAFLAWAHLRTLAYVCWPVHYSAEWRQKFSLLDESFRFFWNGWAKPLAGAVIRLIDTSFLFDEAEASKQVTVSGAT